MSTENFIPYEDYIERTPEQLKKRARAFYEEVHRHKTVRDFSSRDVPQTVIEDCIRAAGTAPNGANMQPWHFAVVQSMEIKKEIRRAAE